MVTLLKRGTIPEIVTDIEDAINAIAPTSGGAAVWGSIGGTLTDQLDLVSVLATKQAAGSYQATLVAGTNIKTINGATILGSGDLVVAGSSNVDGGSAASVYGGATVIDGGGA